MSRPRQHDAGFTLTEVLVATILLSVIMVAVYGLFTSVLSLARAGEEDGAAQREALALFELLARDYGGIPAAGSPWVEGDEEVLTLFVVGRPLDLEAGEGGRLSRVRYRFNAAAGTIIREEAPVEAGLPADPEQVRVERVAVGRPSELVVVSDVAELAFTYVWVPRPEGEYWLNPPVPLEGRRVRRHLRGWGLPQAIEIEVSTRPREGGEEHTWKHRLVTRAPGRQRAAWELDRMLEEGP